MESRSRIDAKPPRRCAPPLLKRGGEDIDRSGLNCCYFATVLPLFFMCFFCPALLYSAASALRLSAARSNPLSRSAARGPLVFANPCWLIWLPDTPPAEPPPAPPGLA